MLAVASWQCAAAFTNWTLHLLSAPDAVCLDGSPAGFYWRAGSGADANKWVIFFEGGGWAVSPNDAYSRSLGPLGSSKSWASSTSAWVWEGLLNPDCAVNPTFCHWTTVYNMYCDGASWSGNGDFVVPDHGNATLHSRGQAIRAAMLATLLSPQPIAGSPLPSLSNASEVVITGASAGGLTVLLHVDSIADTVREGAAAAGGGGTAPSIVAVTNCGFFLDGTDVWGGSQFRQVYQNVVALHNVSGPDSTDAQCWESLPTTVDATESWRCFMAPFVYPYISTPLFLVNSQYDSFQLQYILAGLPNNTVAPAPDPAWAACILSPGLNASVCNATQVYAIQGWHMQFQAQLNMSIAFRGAVQGRQRVVAPGASQAAAAAVAPQQWPNGGVITSCIIHGQLDSGDWLRIHAPLLPGGPGAGGAGGAGPSLQAAVTDWYTQARGPTASYWWWDAPWPSNPTCPPPS